MVWMKDLVMVRKLSLSDWKYKDSEVYLISTGIHYIHVYVMHYPVQSITKALLTAVHFFVL